VVPKTSASFLKEIYIPSMPHISILVPLIVRTVDIEAPLNKTQKENSSWQI
jgi:hypothetical protein